MLAIIHSSFDYLPFAYATHAIPAAIRQHVAVLERGLENGFLLLDRVLVAARLKGNFIVHGVSSQLRENFDFNA